MKHGADANAGTYISRARRKVTPIGVEGEIQTLFQLRIRLINGSPSLTKLKSRTQRLHSEVVLLVNHHAKRFFPVQHQPTAGALGGMFAADQVALHEDLLIERG